MAAPLPSRPQVPCTRVLKTTADSSSPGVEMQGRGTTLHLAKQQAHIKPASLDRNDATNPHHIAGPDALGQRGLVGHILQDQRCGVQRNQGHRGVKQMGQPQGETTRTQISRISKKKGTEPEEREPKLGKELEREMQTSTEKEREHPRGRWEHWDGLGQPRSHSPDTS